MDLFEFVEDKMKRESREDINTVKDMMDAMFAKSAGTLIDMYSVNEVSREEKNWEYTECNLHHAYLSVCNQY